MADPNDEVKFTRRDQQSLMEIHEMMQGSMHGGQGVPGVLDMLRQVNDALFGKGGIADTVNDLKTFKIKIVAMVSAIAAVPTVIEIFRMLHEVGKTAK